jgi:hypothetical protein
VSIVTAMAATASLSIDHVPVPENAAVNTFDPLPDETVLKTGWLSKKGRRGVIFPPSKYGGLTVELEETLVCVALGQTRVLQR